MKEAKQPDLALMLQSLQGVSVESDARREGVFPTFNTGTCLMFYNPLQSLLKKLTLSASTTSAGSMLYTLIKPIADLVNKTD